MHFELQHIGVHYDFDDITCLRQLLTRVNLVSSLCLPLGLCTYFSLWQFGCVLPLLSAARICFLMALFLRHRLNFKVLGVYFYPDMSFLLIWLPFLCYILIILCDLIFGLGIAFAQLGHQNGRKRKGKFQSQILGSLFEEFSFLFLTICYQFKVFVVNEL